jgi:hypothetical protein
MKAQQELFKLLNDFEDLDQENYFFIKNQLAKGLIYKVPFSGQVFFKPTVNRGFFLVEILKQFLKVVESPLSKEYLRNQKNTSLVLMENEDLEVDIYCHGKKMGIKIINFEELKLNPDLKNSLTVSKFFQEYINQYGDVELFLKVRKLSELREKLEEKENIFNSRKYAENLILQSDWEYKIVNCLVDKEEIVFLNERSYFWNKNHKLVDKFTPQDLEKFNLDNLQIKNLNYLHYFINNFFNKNLSNNQLINGFSDPQKNSLIFFKAIKGV